jgi:hypothetical protein
VADLSDEVLMAYADGVLDAAERARVEQEIERHPEYRQQVEKFRATLKPVQQVFEKGLDERRMANLAAWIRREVSGAGGADKPQIVALPGARLRAPSAASRFSWPAKLAASIALIAGGALGWLMHGSADREPPSSLNLVTFGDGNLRAGGDLAKLLETASSGGVVVVDDGHDSPWQLKAIFSFRALDGSPCRRYELAHGTAARFGGYACRNGEAQWLVQAHARIVSKMPDERGHSFAPAGGSEADALDERIRAAMDGDVLQAPEEAQLIANHWAAKSN